MLRLRAAHAVAGWRRRRLSSLLPADLREAFERDGFVEIRDFLPNDVFRRLQQGLLSAEQECRIHQQGDTITRRIAVTPRLRRQFPDLDRMIESRTWRGVMAYVAGTRTRPLYYIQSVLGGAALGPPDPQLALHSDTFQPSLKAWLFLTDVAEDERPLTYVAGSHRLTPERIAWEKQRSIDVLADGDRLSQRGSLRIAPGDLPALGLPEPIRFCVPANTLVAIDTCGFHARGNSNRPTMRVELWAYSRPSPFLPWTGVRAPWRLLAAGCREEWLNKASDWLDRLGLRRQQWRPAGPRRPADW